MGQLHQIDYSVQENIGLDKKVLRLDKNLRLKRKKMGMYLVWEVKGPDCEKSFSLCLLKSDPFLDCDVLHRKPQSLERDQLRLTVGKSKATHVTEGIHENYQEK
jgi:hypothetical protein